MELAIALDSRSSLPLHRQLYDELRRAILSGRLVPRQQLPSSRFLAKSLGISRTTVTQAYEQLLSEGYLDTVVGAGTFVCDQLPEDLLFSQAIAPSPPHPEPETIQLSAYGERLARLETTLQPELQTEISFRYGRPAFDQFPVQLWQKLLSRHCRHDTRWLDYSTDFQGYEPLRQAIARYLCRSRAVQCTSEQILITNGTQQALDLIMRLLINPGEGIALEEPGYLSARRIFLSHGAQLFPISVDRSGLIVSDLIQYSRQQVKLVYVTPSHQFPTGAILSLPRRLELLAWAHQTGALILEDDYDSEYRYGDRPIPALQGLDSQAAVLYMGSFSKVLFPALRIGYLVLSPPLVPLFARAKWLCDRHLPVLDQQVLASFIDEGYLERHLRKMRLVYDQRRQALVQVLQATFGEQVSIVGERAGLHLMVRFQTSLSDQAIIQRAAEQGVGLMSAQGQYLQPTRSGEFIFGYSELTVEQIKSGIQRLAQIGLSNQ
jgi:GntR family transcriptional regulator / MocR family aminotransferase